MQLLSEAPGAPGHRCFLRIYLNHRWGGKNPLTFEIAMVGSLGWTTGSEGFFFKKKDVRMFFFKGVEIFVTRIGFTNPPPN